MKKKGTLYALLIGINHYLPNQLPDGGSYGHLHGCVRDVEQLESLMKTRLGLSDENIFKLTASHGNQNKPAEDPSIWPTYENIVRAFHQILEKAKPGDHVIIHYSGHGGRAKSIYPEEIKTGGIDETLVPMDIGTGGRYLRDLELAHLLHSMAEKKLILSVFLDCCHSGGMVKGDIAIRGLGVIDTTDRPTDTLAADNTDTLLATWQQLTSNTRAATPFMAGGLPTSDKWVVLAACRPQELAYEYKFDGVNKSGALTYWLVDSLQADGIALSYKHLHQRVLARIQAQFNRQRPQLYGDGERAVFGDSKVKAQFAVPVLKVDWVKNVVVLNAGIAHGVRKGAQFAIFPLNATDLSDFDNVAAYVTVTKESVTESNATIDEVLNETKLEQGAQAVLINPSSVRLRSYVRLLTEGDEGTLPSEIQIALKKAHAEAEFGGFFEWVGAESQADFIVAANNGNFEIWDAVGDVIPRINPPLALDSAEAARGVVERLIHLTRYRNVQRLVNNSSRIQDTLNVTFEWLDVPNDHVFTTKDVARLRIRNDSTEDIEIAVLDLSSDWHIRQIYPDDAAETHNFAPGEEDILEFDTYIDNDDDEETNIFKLFATIEGTNFRMLELPSLNQPFPKKKGTRNTTSELEELLSQVVETMPQTRAGLMRTSASGRWMTTQVELRVQRLNI